MKNRNDRFEVENAGVSWDKIDRPDIHVGCGAERGGFMSPFEYFHWKRHPYTNSRLHRNFKPTRIRFPEYSAIATPFRWLNKSSIKMMPNEKDNDSRYFDPIDWYRIPFGRDLGPTEEELGFRSPWVQHPENQRLMLDTFASAIRAHESLVFFYAMDVPLTNDPRRVLVGVGLVDFVGEIKKYDTTDSERLWHGYIWERNIGHSIRPDKTRGFIDGFLLPYKDVLDLSRNDSSIDPERYVAFTPDEARGSFSYATAHVHHDEAISALLECRGVLDRLTQDKVPIAGNWTVYINWIDEQLNHLWRMRGPYPGMGSALSAFGIENGTLIAFEINKILRAENSEYDVDPWEYFELALDSPDRLPSGPRYLKSVKRLWEMTTESDRHMLKLLSRFSISRDQAAKYFSRELSADLLSNPYLLYECDRFEIDGISLRTIDRGLFPDDTVIGEKFPLPEPSNMDGPTDPRRVKAFCVYYLELAAIEGHSLLPRDLLMDRLRETDITKTLTVNDVVLDLAVAEHEFKQAISLEDTHEGGEAYQLKQIAEFVNEIRRIKRILKKRKPLGGEHDWKRILDDRFGDVQGAVDDQELERLARGEKEEALAKLYRSPFSVLVGGAGTGKTTLLEILCNSTDIENSVLLLAPTGKARVRMEAGIRTTKAQTIAQFLYKYRLYDGELDRYSLAKRGQRLDSVPDTVVIDESSMLTEPQLASLLSVVRAAKRIILVGDPQQLPPIGTGRPFVDIIEYLSDHHPNALAELRISRRQQGEDRDDLTLANWFSGKPIFAGDDDIWSKVTSGQANHIEAIRWDEPHQLQSILFEKMRDYLSELEFDDVEESDDELDQFAYSLGAVRYGNRTRYPFFDLGKVSGNIARWQVLSPVRGDLFGVRSINRSIQRHFQQKVREHVNSPQSWRYRKFPPPIGNEEILYGDKVINVVNHARNNSRITPGGTYAVFPREGALEYIANGEIGIVVGHRRKPSRDWNPKTLEVEFASQSGYAYTYEPWEFTEHGTPPLQLAYALTIHKAQGSEFGVVFLILPNPSRMLSRELLYTALTRQTDRVILLHQGDFLELQPYTDALSSAIYRRITNLFRPPNLRPVVSSETQEPVYMEQNLIHTTSSGIRVRSKSELAIAEAFDRHNVVWEYELPLEGKLPDFTIEDYDVGRRVYWEHLGMLHVPQYKQKWEAKKAWYLEQGILPYEEDDGDSDILVTSKEDQNGGLDMQRIDQILQNLFA
ncbi:MAG: ATP-dependent RecD-like DNA helicase [Chloroflexi bacterium]|nr:ATP-dependent RecD-like DNA helicase [Chloroflexota bacterium]